VADPEILKGGGAEDNVSASSSFIANAHNELYAFYTGKGRLLKKNLSHWGVGAVAPTALFLASPLFEFATVPQVVVRSKVVPPKNCSLCLVRYS